LTQKSFCKNFLNKNYGWISWTDPLEKLLWPISRTNSIRIGGVEVSPRTACCCQKYKFKFICEIDTFVSSYWTLRSTGLPLQYSLPISQSCLFCQVDARAQKLLFYFIFKGNKHFFFADTKDFKNNFLLIVLLLGWNIPLRTLHALKTVCWNWRIDVSDCCRFFWWFLLWIFTYFLVNTFFYSVSKTQAWHKKLEN